VTSGRWDRSSPLLSTLCDHLRHCRTMPGTVATSRRCWGAQGQDVATTTTVPRTGPPSTAPSNRPMDRSRTTNHYAATLEAAPVRAQDASQRLNRSRIRQDGRQLHGTARHASTRREIVRHACKLLPPWPIKGGAVPQPQGTRDDG
jgi:predicted component of type VI protein secretion system